MDNEISQNHEPVKSLLYKEEVFAIQGAIFEVYRVIGCGFIEAVYQESLVKEFILRQIPFSAQTELTIFYKGEKLNQTFRPDFICYQKIIVELKAVKETGNEHRAQVMNYLKAADLRLGLLVNFGHFPKATVERVIF
jgi:GxxExxY protein